MDSVISSFLARNLPKFQQDINITITPSDVDNYVVTAQNGRVNVVANCYVSAFNGLYDYLKKYCNVQLSWCGNRTIDIDKLVMFDGEMCKTIVEKYRVYMNYCTLDYSMCWWDFARWEKEIDFMAMNGINMPLAVVGSEAVWYKTLLDLGFSKAEALSTVSGPAFMAWHLMTNIDSYMPPSNEKYIEERLALGKAIIDRYVEFGMMPIEQGFSGHVPMMVKDKFKHAKILAKKGWCLYPKTAQIDPLDPIFKKIGLIYLRNMDELFGNYHFIACDPFHEGTPPKKSKRYLSRVGMAINELYEEFDHTSTWVMQGWTPWKHIICAVPKERLLILDISSLRYKKYDNFYGYRVVAGMLHNFGGKNAMQGKIRRHADNAYMKLKDAGVNVVGTGMFMEGIEQNPVVYDLQFRMLTEPRAIDFDKWLSDYIVRRYGSSDEALVKAWSILMETCYSDGAYEENEVGSTIAARPQPMPFRAGPCCKVDYWYDNAKLKEVARLMLSVSDKYAHSDGYQYDLCDVMRQVMSNEFHDRQREFATCYKAKDVEKMKSIAKSQLELIMDVDEITSHRSEMCFSRWICDAHNLATNEEERRYFDKNARTLVTLWGDINGSSANLYDYSWREWSGLIRGYYYPRWEMFYREIISATEKGKKFAYAKSDNYCERLKYRSTPFNERLYQMERAFGDAYEEYDYPVDSDVIPSALRCAKKYGVIA